MTAKEMYDHLKGNDSMISYHYVSKSVIDEREIGLKDRFNSAVTVTDTEEYHHIVPMDKETIRAHLFSRHVDYSDLKLIKKTNIMKQTIAVTSNSSNKSRQSRSKKSSN